MASAIVRKKTVYEVITSDGQTFGPFNDKNMADSVAVKINDQKRNMDNSNRDADSNHRR